MSNAEYRGDYGTDEGFALRHLRPRQVWAVASRWGLSAQPDDVEAIAGADGEARWPNGSAYNLRSVLYYTTEQSAQIIADKLGPHRPGALVSVCPHDADASYIRYNDPQIRVEAE